MWTREDTTTTPSRQEMSADSSKGKLQAAAQIRGHPDTTTTTPSRQEEEKVSAATNNAVERRGGAEPPRRGFRTPQTPPPRHPVARRWQPIAVERGEPRINARTPQQTPPRHPVARRHQLPAAVEEAAGCPRQASREYQLLPGNSRKPEAAKLPGSISCYQGTAEIRSRQASRGYQLLPGNG